MLLPTSSVAHLYDSFGILLRRDAVLAGVDDNALRRLVKSGVLVWLRQGIYCRRSTYLAADARERHRLLCRGVMRLYGDHVVLSHASACIAQGGPDYGLTLDSVHLTHLSGNGRQQSRIRHHAGEVRVGDVRRQDDHWIMTPARAVLETACVDGGLAGLVQANHFLHKELMSLEELHAMAEAAVHWPGSIHHHLVRHLADPRIESVGETRSDHLFFTQGLPRPELQHQVFHPDGRLAAVVDFAWPEHKVIVEFDGEEKYHRYRREGETIEQMVTREKKREDLIRELTGWTVIRIVWADLDVPAHTAARVRRAFALAASPALARG